LFSYVVTFYIFVDLGKLLRYSNPTLPHLFFPFHVIPYSQRAVSLAVKLKGLLVISGLRGLNLTANSSSSSSLLGADATAAVVAAAGLLLLTASSSSREAMRLLAALPMLFCRWSGGFWATARRGGAAPWKREKDETATSPVSGESGWLLELYLEAS
jgi:hypothetical protein